MPSGAKEPGQPLAVSAAACCGPRYRPPAATPTGVRKVAPAPPRRRISGCTGRRKGAARPCGMGLRPTLPPPGAAGGEPVMGKRGRPSAGHANRPGRHATAAGGEPSGAAAAALWLLARCLGLPRDPSTDPRPPVWLSPAISGWGWSTRPGLSPGSPRIATASCRQWRPNRRRAQAAPRRCAPRRCPGRRPTPQCRPRGRSSSMVLADCTEASHRSGTATTPWPAGPLSGVLVAVTAARPRCRSTPPARVAAGGPAPLAGGARRLAAGPARRRRTRPPAGPGPSG